MGRARKHEKPKGVKKKMKKEIQDQFYSDYELLLAKQIREEMNNGKYYPKIDQSS